MPDTPTRFVIVNGREDYCLGAFGEFFSRESIFLDPYRKPKVFFSEEEAKRHAESSHLNEFAHPMRFEDFFGELVNGVSVRKIGK